MLYRVFLAPLTIFFAVAFFWAASPAVAQDGDAYLARGISVDVEGKSALDARNRAFAEARRKAYETVAAKLVSPADAANLAIPDDRVLASLVRDFEIQNEKMTSRRYAGTIDIRFTPAALKRSLQAAASGLPAAEQQQGVAEGPASAGDPALVPAATGMGEEYIYSPRQGGAVRTAPASVPPAAQASAPRPVLVLPWYGPMGRQTLWGQGNPWRAAWENNAGLARDRAMPILLPVGDVDDLRDYSPPQPMSRRGNISSLLKRYGAVDAVLAMAEPAQDGGLVISLYRYENDAPVPLGRFGVDAGPETLAEAVAKAAASLRAMPAASPASPVPVSMAAAPAAVPALVAPAGGTYRALARFSGLQQWVAMRQALSRVPGVGAIDIRSISPSQAQVEFTYSGDYGGLAALLSQSNITLAPLPAGTPSPVPGAATPQFMLTSGRGY